MVSIHSSQIKKRTQAVVNVGQERHGEVKVFGTLWFLLLWLLQAHSGGLEVPMVAGCSCKDGTMRARGGLECVVGISQKQDVFVSFGEDTVLIEQKERHKPKAYQKQRAKCARKVTILGGV